MHKKITLYIVALFGTLVLFNSCKKEYDTIQTIDEAKIQAYLKQSNIDPVKDPSGFYYQILDKGTGEALLNKDSVFYNMTIKSLSGQVFYTTAANANEANYLGYVSPDPYRIALNAINRGGKVRVIVPSYLAFGKNGNDVVPSNEVIVTEISVSPEKTQWEIDDRLIKEFLLANNLTVAKHPSRVYYAISTLGTGTAISQTSDIRVKYVGKLLNGTVFDQSATDATYNSALDDNIEGWRKVLVGIKAGTKLRIFVPSDLGYGKNAQINQSTGVTVIPANAILDFEIEVVGVDN